MVRTFSSSKGTVFKSFSKTVFETFQQPCKTKIKCITAIIPNHVASLTAHLAADMDINAYTAIHNHNQNHYVITIQRKEAADMVSNVDIDIQTPTIHLRIIMTMNHHNQPIIPKRKSQSKQQLIQQNQ